MTWRFFELFERLVLQQHHPQFLLPIPIFNLCGVYCTKFELILKVIPTTRPRGARGGLKLNRTIHESSSTSSFHSATPKRINLFKEFAILPEQKILTILQVLIC
ncbi:MAG: hypothetical protein KBB88_01015 [Candidatus Pacebacteria bacterium]|nr:hypothetical protein [Candidatus Paceibacterota bacterium]